MVINTSRLGQLLASSAVAVLIGGVFSVGTWAEEELDAGDWLERIEARADEVQTLQAEQVRYVRERELLGDVRTHFGQLKYEAGPPARFAVAFDRVVIDEQMRDQVREYVFDGRWLAERQVDDEHRVFTRRELVPEDEVGRDLLRLGEGPFALPLDLERETVEERFHVELVEDFEPIEGLEDVPMIALRLTPREHVEIEQSEIVLWYDREDLLPVQTYFRNDQDQSSSTITLHSMQTGIEFEQGTFDTTPPRDGAWQVQVVPLEDD